MAKPFGSPVSPYGREPDPTLCAENPRSALFRPLTCRMVGVSPPGRGLGGRGRAGGLASD